MAGDPERSTVDRAGAFCLIVVQTLTHIGHPNGVTTLKNRHFGHPDAPAWILLGTH
jgi:hypothetical protein